MADGAFTRLLTDNRLSEQARIIGYWLLQQEGSDGWVEARFDDIRPLLHGFPSDDVIRKHLRMLRGAGWAERKAGGRGHGDSYRIIDPLTSDPIHIDPPESGAIEHIDREITGSKSDRPARERGYEGDSRGSSSSHSHGGELPEGGEGEVEEGRAEDLDENWSGISDEAKAQVIRYGEKFDGCRSALLDYLRERVPPDKQRAYVHTLATVLDGADMTCFEKANGRPMEREKWTAHVAYALNDLATSDEGEMSRKTGDFAHLRTKMRILARDQGRTFPRKHSSDSSDEEEKGGRRLAESIGH